MKLFLLTVSAALAISATPMMVTFTGTTSGSIVSPFNPAGDAFTDAPFTMSFEVDSSFLIPAGSGPAEPGASFLPLEDATLAIAGQPLLMDGFPFCGICFFVNSLFVDPSNSTAGLTEYFVDFEGHPGPSPYLVITDPAFRTWDLASPIGPININASVRAESLEGSIVDQGQPRAGIQVNLNSLFINTFQVTAETLPSSDAPESNSLLLLGLGTATIAIGSLRKGGRA